MEIILFLLLSLLVHGKDNLIIFIRVLFSLILYGLAVFPCLEGTCVRSIQAKK